MGALQIEPTGLQHAVGQFVWLAQFELLTQLHDCAASAFCGATNEAITGKATNEARPIFLITSRLD
jgi:hypothetical protein